MRPRHARPPSGAWSGGPFALPTPVFLIRALHHAAQHRAQVATILGQRGIEPPVLDGWTYAEEAEGG